MSHHYEPPPSGENPPVHAHPARGKRFHRTWWFWLAIALMLAAMLLYGLASEALSAPAGSPGSRTDPTGLQLLNVEPELQTALSAAK